MKKQSSIKYEPAFIQSVKAIANEEILVILDKLDILDDMKDRYPKYINGPCPIHQGNNRTGFSWDYNLGRFKCWTNSCGDDGDDVISLVSKVEKISFYNAIQWIMDVLKMDVNNLKFTNEDLDNIKFIKNTKNITEVAIPSAEIDLRGMQNTDYLEKKRGFSSLITEKYKPKITNKYYMEDRIALPVWDRTGVIVGLTGRILEDDEENDAKWLHSEFNSGDVLYNLNFAAEVIKKDGIAVLVEGPFDVMAFEEVGIGNSVALLGKSIDQKQISLLLSSGVFGVILALDNDEAGIKGTGKIKEDLDLFCNLADFKVIGKDVGEMDKDSIIEEYNKAKEQLCI